MRRIILLCFTGTLTAVACDPAPAPRSEPSAAESLAAATDTGRNEAPDCGKTNIAGDEYGTEIHPVSCPPGTVVNFSGTTLPHHFTVTSANGECPSVGEGGYAIMLSDYSGPPGSSVTASGTTPVFAKDGSYVGPRGEIQFWWNADPDYWPYALPGPPDPLAKNGSSGVKLLGTMQLIDCTFEFQFKVPEVSPGDYPILPLAIDPKGSGA